MAPDGFDGFWTDVVSLAKSTQELKALKGFQKFYLAGADDTGLRVAGKAGGKPNLVPRTLFMVLWHALSQGEPLNREAMEEEHNLSRVLFLMTLVSRLDYIEYDEAAETIRLAE